MLQLVVHKATTRLEMDKVYQFPTIWSALKILFNSTNMLQAYNS